MKGKWVYGDFRNAAEQTKWRMRVNSKARRKAVPHLRVW